MYFLNMKKDMEDNMKIFRENTFYIYFYSPIPRPPPPKASKN